MAVLQSIWRWVSYSVTLKPVPLDFPHWMSRAFILSPLLASLICAVITSLSQQVLCFASIFSVTSSDHKWSWSSCPAVISRNDNNDNDSCSLLVTNLWNWALCRVLYIYCFSQPLPEKCFHPPFSDEKTEAQRGLIITSSMYWAPLNSRYRESGGQFDRQDLISQSVWFYESWRWFQQMADTTKLGPPGAGHVAVSVQPGS